MRKGSMFETALSSFNDEVVIDIEDRGDGTSFVQAVLRVPSEICHECGPELKDVVEQAVRQNPIAFIQRVFGDTFKNVEWGQIEDEHLKVLFDQDSLVVDLNFVCDME